MAKQFAKKHTQLWKRKEWFDMQNDDVVRKVLLIHDDDNKNTLCIDTSYIYI